MLCIAAIASAQYYVDKYNPDMLHIRQPRNAMRTEFFIPDIDGYKGYKADLHTHTIYSDGGVTMEVRLGDAWKDGLDVMAVTEHLEYRAHEPHLVNWLKGYTKKGAKADNYYITRYNPMPEAKDLNVDFQYPIEHARAVAKAYDITIIPGIEITREPLTIGHFNALFTTDNNAIHDPDPMQSLRNAKAQGAMIMHNHPGWRRKSMEKLDFDKKVYAEGLIDGIEVMNGAEFYPKAITRAFKYGLFISSNTDLHGTSSDAYDKTGAYRNMTFIYAKDKSLEGLREALKAGRTIAYSYGTIVGEESLIRKFVDAALEIRCVGADNKGKMQYIIKNNSSVEFMVHFAGNPPALVKGLSSIILRSRSSDQNQLYLDNVWYGEDKQLVITVK